MGGPRRNFPRSGVRIARRPSPAWLAGFAVVSSPCCIALSRLVVEATVLLGLVLDAAVVLGDELRAVGALLFARRRKVDHLSRRAQRLLFLLRLLRLLRLVLPIEIGQDLPGRLVIERRDVDRRPVAPARAPWPARRRAARTDTMRHRRSAPARRAPARRPRSRSRAPAAARGHDLRAPAPRVSETLPSSPRYVCRFLAWRGPTQPLKKCSANVPISPPGYRT